MPPPPTSWFCAQQVTFSAAKNAENIDALKVCSEKSINN